MSRIIVKNLPPETNEDDLKKVFSQKGTITNVEVKRFHSGKSRQYAFIGYHDETAAKAAIESLNHTFIKTNKIIVEKCLRDAEEQRRSYKYHENDSKRAAKRQFSQSNNTHLPEKRIKNTTITQDILMAKYTNDPEFAEFLDMKAPLQADRIRAKLHMPTEITREEANSVANMKMFHSQKLKRREVLNLLYHVKMRGLPRKANKTMIKEFLHPLVPTSIRMPKVKGIAYVGFMHEHERVKALKKDKSYMSTSCVRIMEYNENYMGKVRKLDTRPLPTKRLYFFGCPFGTTPEEIKSLFSAYGELKSLILPRWKKDNVPKGFGLVTYVHDADAVKAFAELKRTAFKDKIVIGPERSGKVKNRNFSECLEELGEKFEYSDENEDENVDETEQSSSKSKKWKNQEDALKNEESISESGRIFLRNLSYTTQEADIEKLFSTYGPLSEVNLPIDSDTKRLKGFGTVTFLMPEHAVKAFTELDGSELHGRLLHLLPAKSKDTPDVEDSANFKRNKLNKQKAQAGKSHNWNALFVDHNAVAEVVAEKFGISKEAVVGPEVKGSAAVRLALAETQIVNETKKYLETMGVKLDAFSENKNAKRSKTVILVKNLPSKTTPKEIKDIFQKHGHIGRVILPPSGLTAIVEYLDPSEARKAFVHLAYTKFKNVPLYLEWAPEDSLGESNGNTGEDEMMEQEETELASDLKTDTLIENADSTEKEKGAIANIIEGEPEPDTTLFVKNVNFQTKNDALRAHFETVGPLYYAYVATKKLNNLRNAPEVSRGYGFVRYMRKSDAEVALELLQQTTLDGKSLELQKSDRVDTTDSEKAKSHKDQESKVKIIVKNVPFAAKKKEVEQIFVTFGKLKRVKLPNKVGSESKRHRGFAFVEYFNESDAKTAYEALHLSTHLLGRRLVLQWANDDKDVKEIRMETEAHYVEEKKSESKKSVFKMT